MNHLSPMDDAITEEIAIKASAERVFAALTSPEHLVKWWGDGKRFKTTHMECDLRRGGKWLMSGIGVGGAPFTVYGVYQEVVYPRTLEFTWLPSWQEDPFETVVRFDIEEKAGVTRVRVTHRGLKTVSSRSEHRGWPRILDWLRGYLEDS